jgi:hypothetical protein
LFSKSSTFRRILHALISPDTEDDGLFRFILFVLVTALVSFSFAAPPSIATAAATPSTPLDLNGAAADTEPREEPEDQEDIDAQVDEDYDLEQCAVASAELAEGNPF